MAARDADEIEALLNKAQLAAGVVRRLDEVVAKEDLKQRGLIQSMSFPGLPDREHIEIINLGFKFEHDGPDVPGPAPWKGEHSLSVLEELGYSEEERTKLVEAGVIAQK